LNRTTPGTNPTIQGELPWQFIFQSAVPAPAPLSKAFLIPAKTRRNDALWERSPIHPARAIAMGQIPNPVFRTGSHQFTPVANSVHNLHKKSSTLST
jgi:hypothetical protein